MAEILLVRHAKSYANDRDTAFGNVESPLNEKGIGQAIGLNQVFREEFDIVPEEYDRPILSSYFQRAKQTAELAGFKQIDNSELIAEADIPKDMLAVGRIVLKHAKGRWVPEEAATRSRQFI